MPKLSKQTIAAVQRYGPTVQAVANQYGISGAALLAKLVEGESGDNPNAVSPVGAKGRAQFMPGSRQTAIQKYGVDPWSHNADQAVHAAALHLRGLINGSKGLAGYNPGDPSYTGYILGQKVGDVAHYGSGGSGGTRVAPGVATQQQRTTTTTTPGVDNSGLRRQLVASFLQSGGVANRNAVLALAGQYGSAADVPGSTQTQTTTTGTGQGRKASPSSAASVSGSKILELIYNDGGKGYAVKNGKVVNGQQVYSAVWAGHANHVHVAAGPKTVVRLGKLAESMGLHVGENPHFGGVEPVHVQNSYHYKGEAIDVSGDAKKLAAFARKVEQYNRRHGGGTGSEPAASQPPAPRQAAPAPQAPPAPAPTPTRTRVRKPSGPVKTRLYAHPDRPGAKYGRDQRRQGH